MFNYLARHVWFNCSNIWHVIFDFVVRISGTPCLIFLFEYLVRNFLLFEYLSRYIFYLIVRISARHVWFCCSTIRYVIFCCSNNWHAMFDLIVQISSTSCLILLLEYLVRHFFLFEYLAPHVWFNCSNAWHVMFDFVVRISGTSFFVLRLSGTSYLI